jgi:cytochrome-b5 reductase
LPTGQVIIRPYTPISTNQLAGCFDLLVKDYGPNALMSHILCQQQPVPEVIGTPAATDDDDSSIGRITFSHSNANVKIQAPFPQNHIVLLAGGTGIAPMLQALHAMLGTDPTDDGDENGTNETPRRTVSSGLGRPNKITLLYGSKTQHDILARQLLDRWSKQFDQIFTVEYILSEEPMGSSWNGRRGYINQALLEEHGILPPSSANPTPDDDSAKKSSTVLVMVCGPPSFYDALCGPRGERAVISGALGTLGFSADQIYKF